MNHEEGRHSPDDVERKHESEDAPEVASEEAVSERRRADGVQTKRESKTRRDDDRDDHGDWRSAEIALKTPACLIESPERDRVEDDVHDLEEHEEEQRAP